MFPSAEDLGKKKIPSFEEVMEEKPKVPSFEDVMGGDVKKKGSTSVSTTPAPTTSNNTSSVSETPLLEENKEPIPTVMLVNGEAIPSKDPIALSLAGGKFKDAKKEIEVPANNKVGYTKQFAPDEEKIKEYNDTKTEVGKLGYDIDELAQEFSDFPEDAFNNPTTSKEALLDLRGKNRVKYHQLLNEAKNRYAIRQAAAQQASEKVAPDQKGGDEWVTQNAVIAGNEYVSDGQVEDFTGLETAIAKKQKLINTHLVGEEREKANKRLQDTYAIDINPDTPGVKESYEASPFKNVINATQFAGLETLRLFDPVRYENYANLISENITPQWDVNVQVTPEESVKSFTTDSLQATALGGKLSQLTTNQRIGKETVLRQLSNIGASNYNDGLVKERMDLIEQSKNITTPEQEAELKIKWFENESKLNALKNTEQDNDKRYPLTAGLKFDNFVKEALEQKGISTGELMYNSFAHHWSSSVDAVEGMIKSQLGSQGEKNQYALKRIGEHEKNNAENYLPENERRIGSEVITEFTPQLKDKLKTILNGRSYNSLSKEEKQNLIDVVSQNPTEVKTITNPEAGKPKNFLSKATLISSATTLSSLGGFMSQMGLLKGLGMGAKSAEALTLFMPAYSDAVSQKRAEGWSEDAANEYGILHGGIMASMALFGSNYQAVINTIKGGGKNALEKKILGMGEDAWNALYKTNKPLIEKAAISLKNVGKEQAGMITRFGVAPTVLSGVADNLMYGGDKSAGDIAHEAVVASKEMLYSFSPLILGGVIKGTFKPNATMLEKSAFWELADEPNLGKLMIDEKVKSGELKAEDGEARKKIIDEVSKLIPKVPTATDKGKLLTDDQKIRYLWNLATKDKSKEAAKDLPEKQAATEEYKGKVADYTNQLILSTPTDKQLESSATKLKKDIEAKDENGKPILNDKQLVEAKAELEAVTNELETRKKGVIDTKLSEPIEGLDEQGIPIGDNVPKPTDLTSQLKEKLTNVTVENEADLLGYAIDKVSEAPTKLKEDLGEELFNQVLEKVPTEKLQESLDYLLDKNPDSKDVDVLDKIISQREIKQQSGKDVVVEAVRRNAEIINLDNRRVAKLYKEELEALSKDMQENEAFYQDKYDDAQHLYNIVTDRLLGEGIYEGDPVPSTPKAEPQQSGKDVEPGVKFPLPKKPVEEMTSVELDNHIAEVKEFQKKTKLPKEQEDALTGKEADEYFGKNLPEGGVYDPVELQRIRNRVSLIEEAETLQDIAATIKRPLIDYAKKKDTENLAVIKAAKRKADELGISTEDFIKSVNEQLKSEFKGDADAMSKIVFDAIETKPTLNEGKETKLPNTEKKGSDTASTTGEATSKTESGKEGGKEPPAEPPTKPVEEGGKKKDLNDKGVLNHLVSAENVPEVAKNGFKEKGLKYETSSQKEAEDVAKSVIDGYGIKDAVLLADAQKFDGDVNSLIYAESLNRLAKMEAEAKTPEERLEFAKEFAEVGIKYDEAARKGGRFTSAINYFYKKSPLGVQMIENAKRKEQFEEWSKPKDKSWKEFFDEMMKEPEFEKEVSEKVKEEMKKERADARKERIKKVDEFFDKAKDQFKGGAAYSTIIPPQVITAAIEGMKQAYHAGEKVVKLIEDAVDYISEKLGNDTWDKDKFRKEWSEKLKDKETKKPLSSEELKTKILDRFRKKLKGLTDKEKEEVVRKAFQKIVESGGLDYADFKKIISDITGRGELTVDEVARLKKLVEETNLVDDAAKKAQAERTQQSLDEFYKVQTKAAKASKELNELLYNKPNIIKRLTSIMQLNTLGIPALVNNPVYNIWNQTTLRMPVGLVKTGVDAAITGVGKMAGKNISMETNILNGKVQLEFFKKLGLGLKESATQFFTGLNRADYTAKEIQGDQIRPATAWRDLISNLKGKKHLSGEQKVDKWIQATAGVPAEIVARTLNLGDKPQRFAAEGAQASAFAKALGLKDIDYNLFIAFPREEAYAAYKKKGLSDADAAKKADYVKDTIIKEGQRSTFQQDNMLNDILNKIFGGEKSGVGSFVKAATISPYIKIPSNAYWSYYNLVNPEIALLQSMIYGGKAALKQSGKYKRFIGDKDNTSAAKDLNEAKYWFAHAAVGIATRAVVMSLVGQGIVRTSNTGDDTKKEREGEQYYEQQGTINVSKLWAVVNGRNPDEVKNGLVVANKWFGHYGTMANAIEKKQEDMTPEQKEKQDEFWAIAFGGMETDALKDLNQGVFSNTSSLLTSVEREDFKSYGVNLINMMTNIVQPATIAQMTRASMPYYTKQKADTFLGELNNSLATRSVLYRKLSGNYPPTKIGIWGDKLEKKDNFPMRLFGISRSNPDNFAQVVYEDMKRTDNIAFLPPSVKPEIRGNGETIKLPTKDAARLEELVGQQRRNLAAPYVNDMATFEGSNKKYSQLTDEEKLDKLSIIYEEGFKNGKEIFLKENPKYLIPAKTKEEKSEDKKDSRSNKKFRKAIQKR